MTNDQFMPRWASVFLATLAATIGLAASVITAKFFILGLERLEADNAARDILIATGVLMILTELMAFGLSALLPVHQLRALRTKLIICGTLLLTFEAATIYITQVALMQNATAAATASETKINGLRAAIDSRRAAAKSLRANGTAQSESSNAWTRTLGAKALRDALQAEQQIDPLTAELAQLQGEVRPNLTTVIGENGMLIYSVTRAFLISVMGLVMFTAAGALLRESRPKTAQAKAPVATVEAPTSVAAIETVAVAPIPVPTSYKHSFRLISASLATLAFAPAITAQAAIQTHATTTTPNNSGAAVPPTPSITQGTAASPATPIPPSNNSGAAVTPAPGAAVTPAPGAAASPATPPDAATPPASTTSLNTPNKSTNPSAAEPSAPQTQPTNKTLPAPKTEKGRVTKNSKIPKSAKFLPQKIAPALKIQTS